MVTVAFSMLSLATKTHTSFGMTDAPQIYSDADVIKMLEHLLHNIFVKFGGRIFQQTIGIPMGTNCALLLADLFFYTRMRRSLYKVSSKQARNTSHNNSISPTDI